MRQILMFIILSSILVYSSCESKESHHEEVRTFPISSPVRMDTSFTKEYVCQIHSIQHIELRAQERGYLEKIYVDEGQSVTKGQLLFKIMPRLYQAELEKARAEVNFAEIEYENTKNLADSDIVSSTELAMARAKYEKAKAEMSLAKVHLDFTEIRAPFDGIIDRFHVRQGSLIEEGELLSHLSDNSEMWVYYNVSEAEYLDYMSEVERDSSITVELLMANNKVFNQKGLMETIEADFNHETGNIQFRATFPNPNRLLRHGETGNILMTVPLKDALLIPQKSTFEILDKKYVYVLDEEHRVHQREITVGQEIPHLFAITGGLNEKDKILLEGLRLVKENDEVHYEFETPRNVISNLSLYAE
ncbi:efflux RND transporter periplasmic adaptor subunit [Marivirga salinae]|uniref:Efflux RND transporter periplasmic adaptor subunit n=1 Tax=Marivirga salinarum TaxID=3059078 RepID=A0AA51RDT2_9BACT|nr:efflux RND transporter periplasmic adaptor subunit [Marivirga sp. BDSF4-3]WMN11039.1 efflux RND transporter periplasmic adaptor subunit [Marivirga sp. BDSF4-3]